jgi:predicted Rossmann-fold nucleotide-binding protein
MPGSLAYEQTKRVATALTEMDCDIATGGGLGPMQAAYEGVASAHNGNGRRLRRDPPSDDEASPFVDLAFEHRTFSTWLQHFPLTSDAFVVAPGGIDTVLETTMIWQSLQAKDRRDTPLILVGEMWQTFVEWARASMLSCNPPLANADDLALPHCVADADEAIVILHRHYEHWQAGR